MRVLALDYGSARCGCALSDPTGTIVTPIAVVARPASRRGLAELDTAGGGARGGVRGRGPAAVLARRGHAADKRDTRLRRRRSPAASARSSRSSCYDERFTTRIAAHVEHAQTSEDSRAAAVLLEDWLARPYPEGSSRVTHLARDRGSNGAGERTEQERERAREERERRRLQRRGRGRPAATATAHRILAEHNTVRARGSRRRHRPVSRR